MTPNITTLHIMTILQIVIIIKKEEKISLFSILFEFYLGCFPIIEEEDFSSCSHTIQKIISSYFELPPYFFFYDCLLLRKFKLFSFFFFLCATKGVGLFLWWLAFFFYEKKKGKKWVNFFLMNHHSFFKDGTLRETQESKKDIN